MTSEHAHSHGKYAPVLPKYRSTAAIADLVRRIVHGRRGLSRNEVVNWVLQFVDHNDRIDATLHIGEVVDMLCDLKDIGHGTMHGEPVLVAVPERRVSLPDGKVVALGDHGISAGQDPEKLFPEVSGGATESLLEVLTSFDEQVSLSAHHRLEPVGQWIDDIPMPPTLRRALMLSGAFDPVEKKWSISKDNTAFLNEWFGLAHLSSADQVAAPDMGQHRVTQSPGRLRMVVEAGPGSGKTHVACDRVICLLEEHGLAPSRILLLSFTRIAVAELRDRIGRRIRELPSAAALQIRTFDSFAARLLSNAGVSASDGHDAGIRAATRLMRSDNPLVADALGQLEHVIIDEAQDLVGERKEMCEALIALLDPTCGITVFGDFAQSIYGYQRRGASDATLLSEVAKRSDFTCDKLERDHRTRTKALKDMFTSVRETLRSDPLGSKEAYLDVREQIINAAVENEIGRFAVHSSTTGGLILTRSRRGLITAAEQMRAANRSFKLRLPERPPRVEGWIGAMLGGLAATTRMSQNDFRSVHEALSPAPWREFKECWEILLDLDATGRGHITVGKIAEGLEDPPLELLSDHEGSTGPLLSTIHAIKGRESERVMLLLTRAPFGDRVDWAEEARTLYVGATRASTELRTGWINPQKFFTVGNPERYWAPHHDHRLIEIGLEGDLIEWADLVRSGYVANEAEAISSIWRASNDEPKITAYTEQDGHLVLRIGNQDGTAIGCLSPSFIDLVQQVRTAAPGSERPEVVEGISVVGGTTVVVSGRAGESPSLALMPLLGGFASIPR